MSAILEAVEATGLAQSSCLKRPTFYDLYHYTPALHASVVAKWPRTVAELEYISTINFDNQEKIRL